MSEQHTVNFLSKAMSLRTPQTESLEILDKILDAIDLKKKTNLLEALEKVKAICGTCKSFERDFVSLTFALATGVGKTRLMGAFIAYLYTRHGIKNFFVVAPNTTIYDKIRSDLEESSSPKYVFRGLNNLFAATPKIFSEDDYRSRQLSFDDVAIYLYNIDKFNKENAKMREENETLGDSFFKHLSKIPDLVLIMDESHHYRAERGAAALNELNPVLGLELTATPIVNKGKAQEKFKNVVYEYPLSKAIADGYTRTPYAMTRANVNFSNFGEDFLDEIMLNDGIKYHEKVQMRLMVYADAHKKKLVKPFMLVVCKDTEHAAKIEAYIKSERFRDGVYANKVIKIDSKQKKSESDENIKLLLGVEDSENPIEIVIHVNMLKEGWDVNNLYTIVPLRTAASKILREQMIGRGLRLPYGTRTGDDEIDSVMLTAHDKFSDIIEEAQRGESIFKRGNLITLEDIEEEFTTVPQYNHEAPKAGQPVNASKPKKKATTPTTAPEIIAPEATPRKFIPIPRIKISHSGRDELVFEDFAIDTTKFNNVPPTDEILIKNLLRPDEVTTLGSQSVNLDACDPVKEILDALKDRAEIDYDRYARLIFDLATQVCDYFTKKFGLDGMKKIILNDKLDVVNKIFDQMLLHASREEGYTFEEVTGVNKINSQPRYTHAYTCGLYDSFTGKNIKSVLFTGIKKGVFDSAKFDSKDGELKFAHIIEEDRSVRTWLRPDAKDFNLRYNLDGREHNYTPDFVVETEDLIYMIEIKGENLLEDSDTIEKEKAGINFCNLASKWGINNGFKEWKYLFIPAKDFGAGSTFGQLAKKFVR